MGNNPISNIDPDGEFVVGIIIAYAIAHDVYTYARDGNFENTNIEAVGNLHVNINDTTIIGK